MVNHITDGPVTIYLNGREEWWVNGKLHRVDGPAFIGYGHKSWWINGKRHRDNGPAVIFTNGSISWFINDKHITKKVNDWMKSQNISYPWDEETQVQFMLIFN